MEGNEAPNQIEELNRRLYSKDESLLRKRKRGTLHPHDYGISKIWKKKDEPTVAVETMPVKPSSSMFKFIFFFSVGVFVLSGLYAGYTFLRGNNTVSNDNIDVNILGSSFTGGGDELTLEIEVTNKNSVPLELADLLVSYPKGSVEGSEGEQVRLPRMTLGTVGPGKTSSQSVKVILYGEQGTQKTVKASLEYRVAGSNAIFVKDTVYSVTINSSPIALSLDVPKQVTSNQLFTMTIKVLSNAEKPIPNMLVRMEYPSGFIVNTSEPLAAIGDNMWELGDMGKGMTKEIKITGSLQGQDGEERAFRVYSGEASATDRTTLAVTYTSLLGTIIIKRPFLSTSILVNGADSTTNILNGNQEVDIEIIWENNLETRLTDVEMTATLSGNAYDKTTVKTSTGFYDSLNSKIIWDKTRSGVFASIDPGEQGSVSFSFKPLPLYASGSYISNPQILVTVGIKGKEPSLGGVVSDVTNTESKTLIFASDLQIAGKALHFQGPFTNTGPMPPQADQETLYTVTWSVTNSVNDITGAEAVATLPTYARFVGPTSPAKEVVTYNETTRTVTWKLGNVTKGTGISLPLREASFQIGITPSMTQVGSIPQILLQTVLTGTDAYTNTIVRSTWAALTTSLYNDTSFSSGMERVVQ